MKSGGQGGIIKLGHLGSKKKGLGFKKILGPCPGACKVGPAENLSISKFGFFDFEPKLEAKNQG